MIPTEEAARARAAVVHEQVHPAGGDHPDVLDGTCGRWTWRGRGYVLEGLDDVHGSIIQADTITALYGRWQGKGR